jgi:Skp family chaperone for outer membrane proteins
MALRNAVEASAPYAAPPTAIAVVNLEKLYTGVKMTDDWRLHLNQLKVKMDDERKRKDDALKERRDALEKIADPVQKQQEADEFAMAMLQAEEWVKLQQGELDREQAFGLEDFIRLAREESKKVAETDGYQMVILDDSGMKIRPDDNVKAPPQVQVQQQIASLRVLYSAESVDITEKVKVRMNNVKATASKGP